MKKCVALILVCSFALCLCVGCVTALEEDDDTAGASAQVPTDTAASSETAESEEQTEISEASEDVALELPDIVTIYRDRDGQSIEISDPKIVSELRALFTMDAIDQDTQYGIRTVPTYYVDLHNGMIFGIYSVDEAPCVDLGTAILFPGKDTIKLANLSSQHPLSQEAYDYFWDFIRDADLD